ncbi:hypothetical protein M3Y96_00731700 [Aphelenchoides besseyi]|nr:hypothetical protein M3Y96_00731700 [Aphelenchoides besseyi]
MSIQMDSDVMQRNLRSLTAIDPFAHKIVDHGLHVAVYSFNSEQHAWKRDDVAGPFFIYQRKDRPFFSFIIVNRQNPQDFIRPILPNMNFELNSPYIFINNNEENIIGLWFTNESDCTKAYKLFQELQHLSMLKELPPPPPASEKKDFIKLLTQGNLVVKKLNNNI